MKRRLLANGYTAPGFERVKETFQANLDKGTEQGASFSAYYQGRLVMNLWGGYADQEAQRLWKEDTVGCLFSTTKGASAIVIAHLVDNGVISYEDKVSKYWPEFAANGKGEITLEQLLSNKAGLAATEEKIQLSWLKDDLKRLDQILANQRPLWHPGSAHGYHRITFALYLDAIVRRVDRRRRNLAQYFQEEIAQPFGIDLYIGLPKPYQYRAARVNVLMDMKEYAQKITSEFRGNPELFMMNLTHVADWTRTPKIQNPDFMELPCGSSHGFGTAEATARFYGILANGGVFGGKKLLSPSIISRLQKPLTSGYDLIYGIDDLFSLGLMLWPVIEAAQMHCMFGHTGFGGQNGVADCKYKVGWAYITNHLNLMPKPDEQTCMDSLYEALFQCVHSIENVSCVRKTYKSSGVFISETGSKL